MGALGYEYFLRNILNVSEKGGDVAGVASADYYNGSYSQEDWDKVKAGVGYAIAAYNHKYTNEKRLKDPDDYNKMDEFLHKAVNLSEKPDIKELDKLIEEYRDFSNYADNLPEW